MTGPETLLLHESRTSGLTTEESFVRVEIQGQHTDLSSPIHMGTGRRFPNGRPFENGTLQYNTVRYLVRAPPKVLNRPVRNGAKIAAGSNWCSFGGTFESKFDRYLVPG